MTENTFGQHTFRRFDADLEDIRNRVLTMGGLVEQQIADAIEALVNGDSAVAEKVVDRDHKVNAQEVLIDEECTQILARRQPAAGDLRLVVAVIKTITDLERIGDQAEKVARMALRLAAQERPRGQFMEIQHLGERVHRMLHHALDAFARLDPESALKVTQEDEKIDYLYEGILRQVVTFMMEDPRVIRRSLDVIWAVRALERIGDHSKNICEYVIYLVKGKDVRHISVEQMKEAVLTER